MFLIFGNKFTAFLIMLKHFSYLFYFTIKQTCFEENILHYDLKKGYDIIVIGKAAHDGR